MRRVDCVRVILIQFVEVWLLAALVWVVAVEGAARGDELQVKNVVYQAY